MTDVRRFRIEWTSPVFGRHVRHMHGTQEEIDRWCADKVGIGAFEITPEEAKTLPIYDVREFML